MVYLNIAATRGPTACWPGYRLRNYSPELTLENVAQQELPEDAADIRRVEAAAHLTVGHERSNIEVADLQDMNLATFKQLGFTSIKFFLEHIEPSQSANSSAFTQMMATSRSRECIWPADYPESTQNNGIRLVINSLLGQLRANPEEYAGFSSQADATAVENQFFWRLAQIAYTVVPHVATLKDRCLHISDVFLLVAVGWL